MRIDILTLFPEMFAPLTTSIIGRARDKGAFELNIINIRDFSKDKHQKTDDYPFSGGDGMVMTPQPLYDAIMSVKDDNCKVIYLSPKGKTLCQKVVEELSKDAHLILICGHYEGIDERIIELLVDEQISIGDFVLTGGEIPAMALVDSIARYLPDVLGSKTSVIDESFHNGLLEYPQYTRPREFMGLKVPDVLLNGNHKEIEKWKNEQRILETQKYRPDLLKNFENKK